VLLLSFPQPESKFCTVSLGDGASRTFTGELRLKLRMNMSEQCVMIDLR
jgi:hypothetical protein